MEPATPAQNPLRLVLAVLAGLLAAAFGAWLWMIIFTTTGRIFGAGSVVIGFLVGAAIRIISGCPDLRLAVFSGLVTVCGQVGGYYWIQWKRTELLAKANGMGSPTSITVPLSSVPVIFYLIALVGVYVACSLVMRSGKRAVTSTASQP